MAARLCRVCKRRLRPLYVRLFGHQDYLRSAVVGHGRTGSNYLVNGLRSSSCVRMLKDTRFAEYLDG